MKTYLLRLTAAAVLSALMGQLAPKGPSGRAARIASGLLILVVAFAPIGEIDTLAAAEDLMGKIKSDPLQTEFLEKANRELMSSLISEETEAYILDKARSLGLSPKVQVTMRMEDGIPVPWEAEVTGTATDIQKQTLSQIISEDLGIPEERQHWNLQET